jgi:hypothetical protein
MMGAIDGEGSRLPTTGALVKFIVRFAFNHNNVVGQSGETNDELG